MTITKQKLRMLDQYLYLVEKQRANWLALHTVSYFLWGHSNPQFLSELYWGRLDIIPEEIVIPLGVAK